MKLYEIDDGERHWIAAEGDAEDAKRVYLEVIGAKAEDLAWQTEPPEVSEVAEPRARRLKFYDDDGSTRPLWDEFLRQTRPGLVATTCV